MFKKFQAMYAFMLAFLKAESLIEDGKLNLSEKDLQSMQDTFLVWKKNSQKDCKKYEGKNFRNTNVNDWHKIGLPHSCF